MLSTGESALMRVVLKRPYPSSRIIKSVCPSSDSQHPTSVLCSFGTGVGEDEPKQPSKTNEAQNTVKRRIIMITKKSEFLNDA